MLLVGVSAFAKVLVTAQPRGGTPSRLGHRCLPSATLQNSQNLNIDGRPLLRRPERSTRPRLLLSSVASAVQTALRSDRRRGCRSYGSAH